MTTFTHSLSLIYALGINVVNEKLVTALRTDSVPDTMDYLRREIPMERGVPGMIFVDGLIGPLHLSDQMKRIASLSGLKTGPVVILANMDHAQPAQIGFVLEMLERRRLPNDNTEMRSGTNFIMVLKKDAPRDWGTDLLLSDLDAPDYDVFTKDLPAELKPAPTLSENEKITAAANEYALQLLGRRLDCCEEQTQSSLKIQAAAILRAAHAIDPAPAIPVTV